MERLKNAKYLLSSTTLGTAQIAGPVKVKNADGQTVEVWRYIDQIPDSELWRTHERRRERLVIPASAVVRENDEDHVFIAEPEDAFRLVQVRLGPAQGGRRVVLSGLKGQEQVVIDGAFHLNNERNRQALEAQ